MADSIDKATLVNYARQMAQQYGIDPNIFIAQLNQESGFDPTARNPVSGATGIGQLMPQYYQGVNLTDPYSNIKAAAATDAGYLQRYNGDYNLMLAAYNAGPGNVDKYRGVPPFQETKSYIKNIMGSSSADNTAKIMGTMQSGDTTQQVIDQATGTPLGSQNGSSIDASQGAPAGALSPQDLSSLAQQHGGVAGQVPLDPTVNDPITGLPSNNPAPKIKFTFKDGTNMTVKFNATAGGPDGGWNVVDAGTAYASSKSRTPTDLSGWQPIVDPNTGRIIGAMDPKTGNKVSYPAPKTTGTLVPVADPRTGQTIALRDDVTGQIVQLSSKGGGQVVQRSDGSLWIVDPNTGTASQIAAADPLETEKLKLAIAQAQKQLEPQQQQAFENAYQTIDYLKQLVIDRKMSQADAQNAANLVQQNLDSSLKGTTLFQQEQEQARQREAQAQLGQQILAQRLQTGSQMAQGILNTAANSHIMLPKGQSTLGLNPLSMAMSAVNAFGGGQQMGDLASKLIQGIMGGQVPPASGSAMLNALLASHGAASGGQSGSGGAMPVGAGAISGVPSNAGGVTPGGTNEPGYPPGFEQGRSQASPAPSAQSSGGVLGPDTGYQPTSVGQLGSGALSSDTTPNQGISINTDNPGVGLPPGGYQSGYPQGFEQPSYFPQGLQGSSSVSESSGGGLAAKLLQALLGGLGGGLMGASTEKV